jgi:hypothetical protein
MAWAFYLRLNPMEKPMETITVTFTFDLTEVNNALGNTPNVLAKDAIHELLKSLLTGFDDVDEWGHETVIAPVLERMTFTIED